MPLNLSSCGMNASIKQQILSSVDQAFLTGRQRYLVGRWGTEVKNVSPQGVCVFKGPNNFIAGVIATPIPLIISHTGKNISCGGKKNFGFVLGQDGISKRKSVKNRQQGEMNRTDRFCGSGSDSRVTCLCGQTDSPVRLEPLRCDKNTKLWMTCTSPQRGPIDKRRGAQRP